MKFVTFPTLLFVLIAGTCSQAEEVLKFETVSQGFAQETLYFACAEVAGVKECRKYVQTTDQQKLSAQQRDEGIVALLYLVARQNGDRNVQQEKQYTELKASLGALISELKQQNDLMRTGLRAEILSRIERLPIDLAKDDQAYGLIKKRLESDLAEVFAPRTAR